MLEDTAAQECICQLYKNIYKESHDILLLADLFILGDKQELWRN